MAAARPDPGIAQPPSPESFASLPRAFRDERTLIAAIMAVTALIYSRSLGNDFVFDDHYWTSYPAVRAWSFIWKALGNDLFWFMDPAHLPQSSYYRPLHSIFLALNYHLFGLHPAGWHATTIVIHLIVVWLVYRVAGLLACDRWTGLLAAALFALMPIHAEAVTWLSAASFPLSTAFALGSFDFYLLTWAGGGAHGERVSRRLHEQAISIALFGGALMSHDGTAAFPALIAAHAFLLGPDWLENSRESLSTRVRRTILATWPYAILVAGYFAIRPLVLGFGGSAKVDSFLPLTAPGGVLTPIAALASYAMLLLMPWRAGPSHVQDIVRNLAEPEFLVPIAILAALSILGLYALAYNPRRRLYQFCIVWLLITLAPILHLAPFDVQDRYLYFPSFGFCVLAADMAVAYGRYSESRSLAVSLGAAAAMVAYAGYLLHVQGYWRDDLTLDRHCIEAAPAHAFCRDLLATALEERGELQAARNELEIAVHVASDADWSTFRDLSRVDQRLGDRPAAAHAMTEGLKRYKNPPAKAYAELALLDDSAGDANGAEAALKTAAALPGGFEIAARTRAQVLFKHGDLPGAERLLRELIQRQPNDKPALMALGAVLSSQKRYEEANDIYRRVSSMAPEDASIHYWIALTLHQLGREQEARVECTIALAGDPNDANARTLMTAIDSHAAAH